MGTATDEISHVKQRIKGAAECDVIITSGGISSGKKDLVPIVVSKLAEVLFHMVRMRQDVPMLADVMDEKPILCIHGNVTSCLVCGHVFLALSKNPVISADLLDSCHSLNSCHS